MKKKRTAAHIIVTIIIIYLLIPLLATAVYSLFDKWTGLLPEGFSVHNYAELFTEKEFMLSLGRTVLICIIPILITILLVLLALFVVTIYFPGWRSMSRSSA